MSFVSDRGDSIRLANLIDSDETLLLAPMCGKKISCGAAGDYSAVQANPSRPPPEKVVPTKENVVANDIPVATIKPQTPTRNRSLFDRLQNSLFRIFCWVLLMPLLVKDSLIQQKFPYNIRKSLTRILPFGLLMMLACHKDPTPIPTPEPEPEIPIDTTIAKDTIVVDWNWKNVTNWLPNKDTIKKYSDMDNVRWVFLNLVDTNTSGFTPMLFRRARDSLQPCLDINKQKVRGSGTIYVNSYHGAHLPNPNASNVSGMSLADSIWYTSQGWHVKRFDYMR